MRVSRLPLRLLLSTLFVMSIDGSDTSPLWSATAVKCDSDGKCVVQPGVTDVPTPPSNINKPVVSNTSTVAFTPKERQNSLGDTPDPREAGGDPLESSLQKASFTPDSALQNRDGKNSYLNRNDSTYDSTYHNQPTDPEEDEGYSSDTEKGAIGQEQKQEQKQDQGQQDQDQDQDQQDTNKGVETEKTEPNNLNDLNNNNKPEPNNLNDLNNNNKPETNNLNDLNNNSETEPHNLNNLNNNYDTEPSNLNKLNDNNDTEPNNLNELNNN